MKHTVTLLTLFLGIMFVCVGVCVEPSFVAAQGGSGSATGQVPGPNGFTGTIPAGGKIPNPLNSNASSITDFIKIVLKDVVMPLAVTVVVFFVIYAGYLFVTARGSETQISHAKAVLLYTLIGAAILLGASVIADAVKNTLCQIVNVAGC